MANIVHHEIQDNQLLIENKEYFGIGISKVIVGVENPNRQEILQDPNTGLNYSRNAVEAQEVYNLRTQKHHPWFIVDLETGHRGWYPGCEIHGNILGQVDLKEAPDESSATLLQLDNVMVQILDYTSIKDIPNDGWIKIKFGQVGYVKRETLSSISYADPF